MKKIRNYKKISYRRIIIYKTKEFFLYIFEIEFIVFKNAIRVYILDDISKYKKKFFNHNDFKNDELKLISYHDNNHFDLFYHK